MTADDWSTFSGDVARQPDARRDRPPPANVEYQAGQIATVSIPLAAVPPDEALWRAEILRVTGLTVPDGRRVELAQVRYWGSPEAPSVYCRFLIVDREDSDAAAVDAVGLLREIRRGRRRKPPALTGDGDAAFVLSFNDWQLGKKEGGGTAAFARRLQAAFDAAEQRIGELRALGRPIGRLVIIGGGDIIEGCTIFPNQAYEIDQDRRGQIRNAVTFALAGLDQLGPLFSETTVLAVGGNHGENRIGGKRTTRHDNDDCAVFEHVSLAASRDSRLGHVRFVIAQDENAKTIAVGPWILGTTHGHVFGRGAGAPSAKAHRWYSGQAAGRLPAGDADILITHHFHHYAAQDWGACLWLQTPALDGGSPHFTDGTGLHARPGMLSFVITPEHRFTDMQIL